MTARASSDLLLVGSLPASSTEAALRAAGEFFGDLVFALPDGETGPRAAWVGYERERLVRPHPDVETVEETESPTGIPRHAYETPVFRIRPGVTELHWDSWPRIDDAIASYPVFRALRADGVYAVNVADGPPLEQVRAAVATIRSVFKETCMIAEAGVLHGRRLGNLVLAGSERPLPYGELRRAAAADPFPARVLDGAELIRFASGAQVVTDATGSAGVAVQSTNW